MTANQISYWRNVETERANKASEDIRRTEAQSDRLKALASLVSANASKEQAGTRAAELEETIAQHKWDRGLGLADTITSGFKNVFGTIGKNATDGLKGIGTLLSLFGG